MSILDGWRFCPRCAAPLEHGERRVDCRGCGYVGWANSVPGAEAVCIGADGRVLLGRRRFEPSAGLWDLPGGFVEEGEHPLDALRREVREETALELDWLEFLGIWLEPYDGRNVLCLTWTGRVRGEPRPGDDLMELRWFDPEDLPAAAELAFTHYPAALSAALGRHEHT